MVIWNHWYVESLWRKNSIAGFTAFCPYPRQNDVQIRIPLEFGTSTPGGDYCLLLSSVQFEKKKAASSLRRIPKLQYDWNYLTYTFAKSKFPGTEELANGALVTPIPALLQVMAWRWPGDVFKSNKQINLYHHLSICVASRNKLIVYVAGFL